MSSQIAQSDYLPFPASVMGFNATLKGGEIAVLFIATLSALSTTGLLCFITYRAFFSKHTKIAFNQNLLLLSNLLLGDLIQAAGIMINYHWVHIDAILAPTHTCTAQGWMVNLGDVASGSFVFLIAIHTATGVIRGRLIPLKHLAIAVGCSWVFCITLSSIGPVLYGHSFFTAAGFWCWVGQEHEDARLWAHYVWIFLFEFGTLAIYLVTFALVRKRMFKMPMKSSNTTIARVNRATYYMIMYPIIYTICTAPLAISRMYAMSGGKKTPLWFYAFAGCLIISCGWIDSLVYTITRRVFINSDEYSNRETELSPNRFSTLGADGNTQDLAPEQQGKKGWCKPNPSSTSVLNSITKTTTITNTTDSREKDYSRKPRAGVFSSFIEESDNESLIHDSSSGNAERLDKRVAKV